MSSDANGSQGSASQMPVRRLGVVAAFSKTEAQDLARNVEQYARERNLLLLPEQMLTVDAKDQVDAIVVLGGDGLMMRAANSYPDVPLLGINFGHLGFLALVEQQHWQTALDALVAGHYQIEEGSTLNAVLVRDQESIPQGWAINDVVIRSGTRMIDLELNVGGHFVNTYPGDGLIVSTPHGSTAYCMAAGGPILTAGVLGFAIVPISCHSPIRTPLVSSERDEIKIKLLNDRDATLILDGSERSTMRKGDEVWVTKGEHRFRLVTFGSTNFYEAFRTKFNFAIRPNVVPAMPERPDPVDILHAPPSGTRS